MLYQLNNIFWAYVIITISHVFSAISCLIFEIISHIENAVSFMSLYQIYNIFLHIFCFINFTISCIFLSSYPFCNIQTLFWFYINIKISCLFFLGLYHLNIFSLSLFYLTSPLHDHVYFLSTYQRYNIVSFWVYISSTISCRFFEFRSTIQYRV